MKAIQFIKDYGVDKAREVVATCHKIPNYTFKKKTERGYSSCKSVDLVDLKRLVESIDLINKLGGIEVAKEKLAYGNSISAMRLSYETTITDRDSTKQNVITGVYLEDLEQAIADYESIYSNDMGDDSHIENHVSPNCKVGVK